MNADLPLWKISPASIGARLSRGHFKRAAHIDLISSVSVDAVLGHGPDRVFFAAPPRHGKSETVSFWLPVWIFEHFPNERAKVFEKAQVNLRKLWREAYAEAGVPKGTRLFYSVRHNFGTEMANEGMPLPALANLLGHSDVKMTMRYYNMNKKTIDKARDILNRRALVNS